MTSKEALKMMTKKYNWLCEQYCAFMGSSEMSLKCNKKVFKELLVEPVSQDLKKLKQLEDIEKKIGFDLTKAFELCKQVNRKKVVYTKEGWGIDKLRFLDKLDIGLLNHTLYSNNRGVWVSLDLHEYGKTWALTREELL